MNTYLSPITIILNLLSSACCLAVLSCSHLASLSIGPPYYQKFHLVCFPKKLFLIHLFLSFQRQVYQGFPSGY